MKGIGGLMKRIFFFFFSMLITIGAVAKTESGLFTLSGRILQSNRVGLQNARVELHLNYSSATSSIVTTTTNGAGEYVFENIPAGRHCTKTSDNRFIFQGGHAPIDTCYDIVANTRLVDSISDYRLYGQVKNSRGEGVAGAKVKLMVPLGANPNAVVASTFTNSWGYFYIVVRGINYPLHHLVSVQSKAYRIRPLEFDPFAIVGADYVQPLGATSPITFVAAINALE